MADPKSFPKYAHLSGIAYDQPDLYETDDLPEADQNIHEQDPESESIEQLNINAEDAFSKFKGKGISAEHVDFSDRLSHRHRTGYEARPREWEIVGAGEKETFLQKYERLKCEMKQFIEELSSTKENESKEITNRDIANHLTVMTRQLEELSLDKSLGMDVASNLADPQGSKIKKLLSGLEKPVVIPVSSDDGKGDAPAQQTKALAPEVKFKIVNPKSQSVQLAQAARIADLEARVNRLNALVATTPDSLRKLGGPDRSLVENSRWVAGKVALLDTSQLEAIEARIQSLLTKMDQLAEKSTAISNSTDAERKKINDLYDLMKSTEEMSQLLPRTLDRMIALEALQIQGTNFKASLAEVEALEQVISNTCDVSKAQLNKLEKDFSTLEAQIKKSLEQVEERIVALSKNKKK